MYGIFTKIFASVYLHNKRHNNGKFCTINEKIMEKL